ncbi:MAG TPA: Tol-Pal system beta propeller repeat protein TolB [Geminicoccaceae bacterium]|nr:Tol-Pal system beta propeller repeat protein TolB [Geminicoccaceae bacterium]
MSRFRRFRHPLTTRGAAGLTVALVLALGSPPPAGAVLELDITRGEVEPLPIAVSPFAGDDPAARRVGQQIAEVVVADLERSGLFRAIDPRAFIQSPEEMRALPRFADWRQINAQALVTGQVANAGQGGLTADFRLWDVFAGRQLVGLRFQAEAASWRRIAHQIADQIYERLTGEPGYFDTRIVYVAETGPATRRVKRLAIMDQDGANHSFLTDGGELVLTPRFHPSGESVAYMAYRGIIPHVYLLDLASGRERQLGDFQGMTFAPRFSPDGRTAALTIAQGGNSDIYLLDLATGTPRRLTNHPGIDTSPSFSPDGRRIVFNSDRAGTPQLYVVDRDGSNLQRISFGEGRYGSPAWSPRGDAIAFTSIKGGYFHVGVMRPDGRDERLITRSHLDESPTWAPNGRVILFSREDAGGGGPQLFSIDVTGYNERRVATPLGASDPDWSPLIP